MEILLLIGFGFLGILGNMVLIYFIENLASIIKSKKNKEKCEKNLISTTIKLGILTAFEIYIIILCYAIGIFLYFLPFSISIIGFVESILEIKKLNKNKEIVKKSKIIKSIIFGILLILCMIHCIYFFHNWLTIDVGIVS